MIEFEPDPEAGHWVCKMGQKTHFRRKKTTLYDYHFCYFCQKWHVVFDTEGRLSSVKNDMSFCICAKTTCRLGLRKAVHRPEKWHVVLQRKHVVSRCQIFFFKKKKRKMEFFQIFFQNSKWIFLANFQFLKFHKYLWIWYFFFYKINNIMKIS